MAKQTLTLNKMTISGSPVTLNLATNVKKSSGGLPFEVNSPDPSGLFFFVYSGSTVKSNMRISTTGATGVSRGQGDKLAIASAVLAAKSSKQFIVGPFEPSRFVDNSTGGKTIRVTFYTSAGTSDAIAGKTHVNAFQIMPSTAGIIATT